MRIKLAVLTLVIALHALVIFFLLANKNKAHDEAEVTLVSLAPSAQADSAPPTPPKRSQANDEAQEQADTKLAAQTPTASARDIGQVPAKPATPTPSSSVTAQYATPPPGNAQTATGSGATDTSTHNTSAATSSAHAALQLETRPASCAGAPKPPYPKASRERGEEGSPTLQLHIGVNGLVQNASLLQSSGFARLDYAAMQAVKAWRCRPALDNGTPVAALTMQVVHFSLKTP